ncbi:class I SAM-dependent methyltransferase [Halalkalibacterium halodurans]|jgi:ubiquinone/menaquinone biosynthesis C-methylase UbiE|uniref:class I SAM-dependent methyltransferase n=1 Tax=Halalkalibacterium halodurans TaxID=86665 RepID=UPI001ABB79DC|nr:class I SAM-dependent methyltransferase [Halalkalibacterium halodurans]MED3645778.1 class I SAM-dependent methyltransferase [Halalkalibacterium halodurans]MED4079667.1 class I SAM-dependent methyltransferase [Halalkalibacterium halodurans]MED4084057.1 class I SAM-dependent methyltransferase [Halalkalibacterium halodurans]MED4104535.1 class I SAM-dependent methyltransferase [Halalkalibacterium halodurans]MED4108262.1 class I SAM-dependent methyltransferase [Halalkalibacterium halodurans]
MELENFQEYNDPVLYDKENRYTGDIPFLLKWAGKVDGTIVDLACGTGRATIPLASKGYKLMGVDVHKGMLEAAREKSSRLNLPIEWIKQDCTKLSLNLMSPFIYSVGNVFQHFLTNEEQDSFLTSVNKHLKESGIFIFDTRFPSKEELLQPSTEEYWKSYQDTDTGQKVDVYTISQYDPLTQIQHYTMIRKSVNAEGLAVNEKRTNIRLRYVFPKEMERLLSANGFEIIDVYQDWQETPLTRDSDQMIYVCKKSS